MWKNALTAVLLILGFWPLTGLAVYATLGWDSYANGLLIWLVFIVGLFIWCEIETWVERYRGH